MKAQTANEVVGYIDGKAIILDDKGYWHFLKIPEEFITNGELILESDLLPIEILLVKEQVNILKIMES